MDKQNLLLDLVAEFSRLPSVGQRTAYRYAYAILNMPVDEVEQFSNTVLSARQNIKYCKLCGNYSDEEICSSCSSRDNSIICVVSEPRDVMAIDKSNTFSGVYHILGGELSPRHKVGPTELRIKELLSRLDGVKEVILATNPSNEGDITAVYIAGLIKPYHIKVTRIASGIPIGSNIEYADEVTLSRAMSGRKEI